MYKSPKPPSQPRTVRSIAEKENASSSFPTDIPYDTQAGVPKSMTKGTFRDVAEAARPKSIPQAGPSPFGGGGGGGTYKDAAESIASDRRTAAGAMPKGQDPSPFVVKGGGG